MRLLRDVYLVAGPVYGVCKNIYALQGAQGVIVIDPGMNEQEWAVVQKNLVYWGLGAVTHVLLTHEHYSHCANAAALQKGGVCVGAGVAAAQALESGDDRVAQYAHAFERPFERFAVDMLLEDGQLLQAAGLQVQCLEVPGHSRGSLAYCLTCEGKRVVFTGDTVIPQMLCMHGQTGWVGAVDYDRDALLASLERLSKLQADVLLAGHGELCLCHADQVLYDALVQARMALLHAPTYTLHTNKQGGLEQCK